MYFVCDHIGNIIAKTKMETPFQTSLLGSKVALNCEL